MMSKGKMRVKKVSVKQGKEEDGKRVVWGWMCWDEEKGMFEKMMEEFGEDGGGEGKWIGGKEREEGGVQVKGERKYKVDFQEEGVERERV